MLNVMLYSNLYLAIGSAIVAYTTTLLLGHTLNWVSLFLPFASCFFIYTLNRYTDQKEDIINVPNRVRFFDRYGKWFLIASVLSYSVAFIISVMEGARIVLMMIAPLLIGILYSFGGLKKITIGKNLSVGLAWGSTVMLTGALQSNFSYAMWILFLFFSIESFINTVIFDVKDIDGDRLHGIHTLPVVIGLEKTKKLSYVLNALAMGLILVSVSLQLLPISALILCAQGIYILAYTYFCNEKRGTYFYGFFVDGEFLFLFAVSLLAMFFL